MGKSFRKVVSLVLCILLCIVVFSGCASSGSPETQQPDKSTPAPAPTTDEETPESETPGDKIILTWLNHYQEAGKKAWVENCKKIFEEKYDDITLNIETVGGDTYITILQTKLATEDAPTIFDLGNKHDVTVYDEAGHLADLTGQPCLELIDSDLLKEGIINGAQKGVPIEISGYGVFYNKDVFAENDLKEPSTLTELINVCETLLSNGIQPFATPFAETWAFRYYPRVITDISCLKADNNWNADKMSGASNFSDDEVFKNSIETYFSFKKYWGDDPWGTSWDDAQSMVANGEAAMCIHGSWAVDGFISHNPDVNVGVFPMPISEKPEDSIMIKEPGQQLVLNNDQDDARLDAAYKLYNTIYSPECMAAYAEEAHQMPSVAGDYNMLPALKTIFEYPAEKSFVEAGIPTMTTEYEDVYLETLTNHSMGDTFDMESFCADLDAVFSAIR